MTTSASNRATATFAMKGRFVLLLVSTLAAIGVAEVAARLFVPDPYLAFENRIELFVEDEHAGYRNRPNFRGYAQGTIHVRTNNLGFRGPEAAAAKAPGTLRLLLLGDSITWGVGVHESQTYGHVMANALADRDDTSPVEVLNAGVIGYSLHQELQLLEHRGVLLSPDVVVVGFALNDAYPTEDPFFNISRFHEPARSDVRRRDYPPMPTPASYLYRWLRSVARRMTESRDVSREGPAAASASAWPPGSFEARAWPILQKHFDRMVTLADREGFSLMVLVFPTASQLDGGAGPDGPQALLRDFFDREEVPYVDLLDTFRGTGIDAFLDHMHLTPGGHRLVAARLVDELKRRNWLDP